MIFYWMRKFWFYVVWLLTPPSAKDVARIEANQRCPVDGSTSGTLKCIHADGKVFCMHECNVCGARWFEEPVAKVTQDQVWYHKDQVPSSKSATLSRSGRAA